MAANLPCLCARRRQVELGLMVDENPPLPRERESRAELASSAAAKSPVLPRPAGLGDLSREDDPGRLLYTAGCAHQPRAS